MGCTLGLFMGDNDTLSARVLVVFIARHLVFAPDQVFGCRVALVVFLGRGVVGTAFDDLLHVLRLDVDGQGADDGTGGRRSLGLEADWTGSGHAHIELLHLLRVLRITSCHIYGCGH